MSGGSFIFAAALAAILWANAAAHAQPFAASLEIRARVEAQCVVSTTELNFGVYDATRASQAAAEIQLLCTPGMAVRLALDGGGAANTAARRMTGPAQLNYQLYRDQSRRLVFGDRAGEFAEVTTTGSLQRIFVYGEVTAGQRVEQGNYQDIVAVSIVY